MKKYLLFTTSALIITRMAYADINVNENKKTELKVKIPEKQFQVAGVQFITKTRKKPDWEWNEEEEKEPLTPAQKCNEEGYDRNVAECNAAVENMEVCPYDEEYVKNCQCKDDLVQCETPQTGDGIACIDSNNITLYQSCACPSDYVKAENYSDPLVPKGECITSNGEVFYREMICPLEYVANKQCMSDPLVPIYQCTGTDGIVKHKACGCPSTYIEASALHCTSPQTPKDRCTGDDLIVKYKGCSCPDSYTTSSNCVLF